jgi:formylglycine-generating enzyme required for sulfatase activity/3',5'-cyclic AMP phosphodiesterase CpdA
VTSADPRFHLGREAEPQVLSLLDGFDLGEGFSLVVVVSPHESARAEVAARLSERGRLWRFEPDPAVLTEMERTFAVPPAARPIVWVEAPHFSSEVWSATLRNLNMGRERLRDHVAGLVVLAGPPELLALVQDRPDLNSYLSPVVQVDEIPVATGTLALRWLHLSDLHFTRFQQWERRTVLTRLIEHLRDEVVDKGLGPDLVLVTGDIAQSGRQVEYDQAEGFFLKLMDTLHLDPRRHLFLVPGNHDVDRDRLGMVGEMLSRQLVAGEDQDAIERALRDSMALQALGERLRDFYAFTSRLLGPARAWTPDRPWRADRVDVRGFPVGIIQLNSAWVSGPDDAEGKLLVGAAQLSEALAELPDVRLRVAMMHHPPAWLADFDGRPLTKRLADKRGVDFLLHGHVHDEDSHERAGPGGLLTVLGAATAYVKSRWDKGYSLVGLDGPSGQGEVRYYKFSENGAGFWVPDNDRYEGLPDGIWSFALPAALRSDSPAPAAPAPADAQTPDQHSALIARYRASARAVHGSAHFVAAPGGGRPSGATVDDLFAPLSFAPREARPDAAHTTRLHALLGALLARTPDGTAGRVVLLGDPGSGKTMLTRYLTVWAAGAFDLDGIDRPPELVPLRIPFREYLAEADRSKSTDIIEFLVDQAKDVLQVPRDRAFFVSILDSGQALVLLDGLDEVSRTDRRQKARDYVRALAEAWPRSPMLVTSRIVGYDDAALPSVRSEGDARTPLPTSACFSHLTLVPLTDEALDELIRRWYRAQIPSDPRERQHRISDLLAALAHEPRARELAHNPLLATLVCMVHQQRARLPGERVKLYDLVVDTLLDTLNATKPGGGGGFTAIDLGRQRRYLETLALEMQRKRAAAAQADRSQRQRQRDTGEVVITRDELITSLTNIACSRESNPDTDAVRRRMTEWVAWLAARTGLLVEQRPNVFGFLHLTLMEFLAACALSDEEGAEGVDRLVDFIAPLASDPAWREPILLLIGRRADDTAFVQHLAAAFTDAPTPDRLLILVDGLGEEMDASGPTRRRIVEQAIAACPGWGESAQAHLAASLTRLARFSTRHAEGLRQSIPDLLRAVEDVRELPTDLLSAIPHLVADAEAALGLIAHLRGQTSEGEQLYFLWEALDETARVWPDVAAAARAAQSRLFDHLDVPDRALFETVDSPLDGPVPLWCSIPAGTFMMGNPERKGAERERPQHRVTLSQPFQMAAVPTTNRQYTNFDPRFVPETWSGVPDAELLDHPAVNVSWFAAVSFCRWLAARADGAAGARLPTEAEWEYACRARTEPGLDYWSGDGAESLDHVGWFDDNSGGRTHRVAEKPRNEWAAPREPPRGLYDLHGNVFEWTADRFDPDYYAESPAADPPGPAGGVWRVVRGGSWVSSAGLARAAYRGSGPPSNRNYFVGFRVVLPVPGTGSRS